MAVTRAWRAYAKPGDGVHFPFGEPNAKEKFLIEKLGKINDDWKRFRGARSHAGLFRVASAYRRIGCPSLASAVEHEARELKRKKKKNDAQKTISKGRNRDIPVGTVHDGLPVRVLQRSRVLLKLSEIFLW